MTATATAAPAPEPRRTVRPSIRQNAVCAPADAWLRDALLAVVAECGAREGVALSCPKPATR